MPINISGNTLGQSTMIDADATPDDVLRNKVFYGKDGKQIGTIPDNRRSYLLANRLTYDNSAKALYCTMDIYTGCCSRDTNIIIRNDKIVPALGLSSDKIVKGVSICGVEGSALTVKEFNGETKMTSYDSNREFFYDAVVDISSRSGSMSHFIVESGRQIIPFRSTTDFYIHDIEKQVIGVEVEGRYYSCFTHSRDDLSTAIPVTSLIVRYDGRAVIAITHTRGSICIDDCTSDIITTPIKYKIVYI